MSLNSLASLSVHILCGYCIHTYVKIKSVFAFSFNLLSVIFQGAVIKEEKIPLPCIDYNFFFPVFLAARTVTIFACFFNVGEKHCNVFI